MWLHRWTSQAFDEPLRLNFIAMYEMMIGHHGHALRLYEQADAMPRQNPDQNNLLVDLMTEWGNLPAVNAAHLYLNAGKTGRAQELLAQSRAFLGDATATPMYASGNRYVLASIRAIEGNRDEALAMLRKAIDLGWRRHWYTTQDPNFDSARDDPRFVELLDEMQADLARMRGRISLRST